MYTYEGLLHHLGRPSLGVIPGFAVSVEYIWSKHLIRFVDLTVTLLQLL